MHRPVGLDFCSIMLDLFPWAALAISLVVAYVAHRFVSAFARDQLKKIKCCKPSTTQPRLYSYEEALPYLRGNPHITDGYRQHYSVRETLRSLFALHNETANIWSHLLGWCAFAVFFVMSAVDLVRAEQGADLIHKVTGKPFLAPDSLRIWHGSKVFSHSLMRLCSFSIARLSPIL